jgi:hypothetical protein
MFGKGELILMKITKFVVAAAVAGVVGVSAASAGPNDLRVEFDGFDFAYLNGQARDYQSFTDPVDVLGSVDFIVDGTLVESYGVDAGNGEAEVNMAILNVPAIPTAGGTVTASPSAGSGTFFDLFFGAPGAFGPEGELQIELGDATIAFTPTQATITSTSAAFNDQKLLPAGLVIDETLPVQLTITGEVTSTGDAGGNLSFFIAEGSGVLEATLVPEPATLSLLAAGGLGLIRRRKS